MQRLHFVPNLRLRRLKKLEDARRKKRAVFIPFGFVALPPFRFIVENFFHVSLENAFCGLAHSRTKRAPSLRSISNGSMCSTFKASQAFGIFTLFRVAAARSCVTSVSECASAWAT